MVVEEFRKEREEGVSTSFPASQASRAMGCMHLLVCMKRKKRAAVNPQAMGANIGAGRRQKGEKGSFEKRFVGRRNEGRRHNAWIGKKNGSLPNEEVSGTEVSGGGGKGQFTVFWGRKRDIERKKGICLNTTRVLFRSKPAQKSRACSGRGIIVWDKRGGGTRLYDKGNSRLEKLAKLPRTAPHAVSRGLGESSPKGTSVGRHQAFLKGGKGLLVNDTHNPCPPTDGNWDR